VEDRSGADKGDQVWGVDCSPAGLSGLDELVGAEVDLERFDRDLSLVDVLGVADRLRWTPSNS